MADTVKDDRITVRSPAELRRRLKDAARRNGVRQSDIVRTGVERHFSEKDNELTAYDRAKNAGLIGAVRGPAAISALIPNTSTALASRDRNHIGGHGTHDSHPVRIRQTSRSLHGAASKNQRFAADKLARDYRSGLALAGASERCRHAAFLDRCWTIRACFPRHGGPRRYNRNPDQV
jgi:predicted DNA-binding protein